MNRRQFFRNSGFVTAASLLGGRSFSSAIARSRLVQPRQTVPLRKIAFGSCNRTHKDQSFWNTVARATPDLWISLGDNIYADGLSIGERRQKYERLRLDPNYAAFAAATPIIGIWDDHDYADNNRGGDFEDKVASKEIFLDFFDLDGSQFTDRSGIYQSYLCGTPGERTKVVLLDCRFNMDRSRTSPQLLGPDQWQWLENEIKSADFELLILGTSISLTANSIGFGIEGWSSFADERQRLYAALNALRCPVIVISGDRHQADISRIQLEGGAQIYEFMSSGLTHSLPIPIPNSARISKLIGDRNFGCIEIDWTATGPSVLLQTRAPSSGLILDEMRLPRPT